MGSSSGDSFLWTDTSNNSNNMSVDSEPPQYEQETKSAKSYEKKMHNSNHKCHNEHELLKNHKEAKKRKQHESNDDYQLEKKRIKIEPESDIETKRKNRPKKDKIQNSESHDSVLAADSELNMKVKQEQLSLQLMKPKKQKKHKTLVLENGNQNSSLSLLELNTNEMEGYLDIRVKEEQVPLSAPESVKSKKKRKHTNTVEDFSNYLSGVEGNKNDLEGYIDMRVKEEQVTEQSVIQTVKKKKNSYTENARQLESDVQLNDTHLKRNSSVLVEKSDVEYDIVEEKFSADETVVEKPKKKKRKRDKIDKSAIYGKTYMEDNSNDTSLHPNDFTCNNIASSTVINISTIDTLDDKVNCKDDSDTADVLESDNVSHRRTKISDRIRFEDDESPQETNFNIATRAKAFLKANTNLQIVPKTPNNFTITEDDEIWIIKCPNEINYQKLKNTTMSLDGKCKIKVDGQTYDGISNNNVNRITLMTFQYGQASVTNWPIKGFVNYHRRIPITYIPDNINMINNQINFIPLPETKCRHPLFGANYKKAMKIPTAVKERLESAKGRQVEPSCETIIKTKQKKSKKKTYDKIIDEDCKPKTEHSKKSRKRKNSLDNDIPSKKKKHLKYEPDPAEVWESEKAIEENLFNF